jgi:hypothetical protein
MFQFVQELTEVREVEALAYKTRPLSMIRDPSPDIYEMSGWA